jgi:hypothetical protein
VEKRCWLLENRDQRGLTEKLRCLLTRAEIGHMSRQTGT